MRERKTKNRYIAYFFSVLSLVLLVPTPVGAFSTEEPVEDTVTNDIAVNNGVKNTQILPQDSPIFYAEGQEDSKTVPVEQKQDESLHNVLTQSLDSQTEYIVSGDMNGTYNSLVDAFDAINADSNVNYTITLTGNVPAMVGTVTVESGKNVRLTSTVGEQYAVTKADNARHSIVKGTLTIDNIALNGNNIGGGIDVLSGQVVLNAGATITKCYTGGSGGGINVENQGNLIMNDGEVSYSRSGDFYLGGGISLSDSNFIMNGGIIKHNSGRWGGGVHVGMKSTFTMENGQIDHNTATYSGGGGVYVYVLGTFTMNGGNITHNSAVVLGGGIYAGQGSHPGAEPTDWCKVIINNGNISNNEAELGGGLAAQYNGQIEMTGGNIFQNTASIAGGGATFLNASYSDEGVYFKMTGGEIFKNNALQYAGGIFSNGSASANYHTKISIEGNDSTNIPRIYENTSVHYGGGIMLASSAYSNSYGTITNAQIYGNTLSTGYGGGICVYGGSFLTLTDSIIGGNNENQKNSAPIGGGIATFNGPNTVNVNTSEIIGNESTSTALGGGAMYIADASIATLKKASIFGNRAANHGGGIYASKDSKIYIEENSRLINNEASNEGGAIYTADYSDYENLTASDYQNLHMDSTVNFKDNTAANAYLPPIIAAVYTNLQYKTSSILADGAYVSVINNYDINYIGSTPIINYKIVYDNNGGTGAFDTNLIANSLYTVLTDKQTDISREGFTFIGWNTQADGLGKSYQGGDTFIVTSNVTLYAKWEKKKVEIEPQPKEPKTQPVVQQNKIVNTGDASNVLFILMITIASFLIFRTVKLKKIMKR